MRATLPGPNDPNLFGKFDTNIIVGNLTAPQPIRNESGNIIGFTKPNLGAVFYNRIVQYQLELTLNAIQRIIKP